MTARAIGSVSHPDTHGAEWIYDARRRGYVEREQLDPEEEIGIQVQTIQHGGIGLIQAVRHARARGWSWARIGTTLGISREAAQQRFGSVDEELTKQSMQLPDDVTPAGQQLVAEVAKPPAPPQPAPPSTTTEPEHDFSALNKMSTDEILKMAEGLPKDAKLYDVYLRALREAIVVTLYKREMTQPQIAVVIRKSSQRVSQIIGGYYDRIEKAWEQQRAQQQKGN